MKYGVKIAIATSALIALSGCGASKQWGKYGDELPPASTGQAPPASTGAVSDYPPKIGAPYDVNGKTYRPEDVASYDEVGYASWYGEELAGNATANGERFNPRGISAAHKTLPLPTYVEVTALDTGRTILVRVNDRGPFANDRLIDLSLGAAQQLGIERQGVAGVRVRKVNPNEQERAVLRTGGVAAQRIDTPDSLLTILRKNLAKMPAPVVPVRRASAPVSAPPATGARAAYIPPATTAPASSGNRDGRFIVEGAGRSTRPTMARNSGGPEYVGGLPGSYVVQVAAFGTKGRADTMARKIGAKVMRDRTGKIWRVRYGPYANERDAQTGLAQAKQRGYGNARILRADK